MLVYKRRRRQLIISIFFIFIVSIIILLCFRLRLIFITLSRTEIHLVSQQIINNIITEKINSLNTNLLEFEKDDSGEITFVNSNVIYMNQIANEISIEIVEKIKEIEYLYVNIPLGSLSGSDVFTSVGPTFKIKFIPVGEVKTEFKTDFSSSGINQTKHKVFLNIVCQIKALSIFADTLVSTVLEIPIIETVIVGGVPNTYYHLEGMDDKDSLNILE